MNFMIIVGLSGSVLDRSGVKKFVYFVDFLVFENGMVYLIVLLDMFILVCVGVINVVVVIIVVVMCCEKLNFVIFFF